MTEIDRLRPGYQAELADGLDRFFEPRAERCPWCSSDRLTVRLRTRDFLQHKPGEFTLDRCSDCEHIFQNPRLNPAGLEFYYRDFYDGLGEKQLAGQFEGREKTYLGRAQAVSGLVRPETWLDVGTGHGHFCESARAVFPETRFDGLDLSEGVKLAEEHGRVSTGYRGLFAELADELAGTYEVVSMYHYLEHSTAPHAELDAAHRVLRPGGHLVIEVPDPESRYARLLGRRWLPWLQPQHLHFVPLANLRQRLESQGFTVVLEQRAEAHDPIDLVAAAWLTLDDLAPREDAPWHPRSPGRARRFARGAVLLAGALGVVLAALADRVVRPFAGRARLSNAYRIVARKAS
ncbi:class I SAM-dependent methyltransferase [Amycolatopsis magusensis]|uniref:class I SAM-dependent methyltransferase n=1 Tax=Amycolatopsis magusensis TaxID=882444 RepID=UPI0024A7BCF9|nr:class I SAM-dependent methyltransferase [Amycolatopsis magusensis]MDI5976642.1 class I SAM-dependent methyltransferase [Amycolatopsis magusensis]